MKVYEPAVYDDSAPFWDATRDRCFALPWCADCEQAVWYPRLVCPYCLGETIEWRTHVVSARTDHEELAPQDTDEISGARWGTLKELGGPLRERLLGTGRALWRYRVALHDAASAALLD